SRAMLRMHGCPALSCSDLVSSFYSSSHHPPLHAFPTRRSSDLPLAERLRRTPAPYQPLGPSVPEAGTGQYPLRVAGPPTVLPVTDRKSTRLNSSHVKTSYAVFCLKKKNEGRRDQ